MFSVQLGSALSVHLISTIGPGGTAWLRLTAGAIIFLAIARPPLRSLRRRDAPVLLGLGVTTGLQTVAFLAAIERIPLGTSVAIEFLGPMTVAAVHSHSRRALLWLGAAGVGVVLVTEPWRGAIDLVGVGSAVLAAVGWATYIVLTQRVGDRFSGLSGLAMTVPVAACTAAVIGIPQAAGHLTSTVVLAGVGLAILLPVVPYSLSSSRAADDADGLRHPHGPRACHRCGSRPARTPPEAVGHAGDRHPARRRRRGGSAARWSAPPSRSRGHRGATRFRPGAVLSPSPPVGRPDGRRPTGRRGGRPPRCRGGGRPPPRESSISDRREVREVGTSSCPAGSTTDPWTFGPWTAGGRRRAVGRLPPYRHGARGEGAHHPVTTGDEEQAVRPHRGAPGGRRKRVRRRVRHPSECRRGRGRWSSSARRTSRCRRPGHRHRRR